MFSEQYLYEQRYLAECLIVLYENQHNHHDSALERTGTSHHVERTCCLIKLCSITLKTASSPVVALIFCVKISNQLNCGFRLMNPTLNRECRGKSQKNSEHVNLPRRSMTVLFKYSGFESSQITLKSCWSVVNMALVSC